MASDRETAREEAAKWLQRLNSRSITSEEIEQFYAWRRRPENGAAYSDVERVWSEVRHLQSDPDIGSAVREALAKGKDTGTANRLLLRREFIATGAAALALGAAAYLALPFAKTFRTTVGEQRVVALDDGSKVHLNTDTEVEVRFSRSRRDVKLLHGEALFEVAHDASRPFAVTADGHSVTAIGTRFDVRLSIDELRVSLVEGSVAVTGSGADARLRPGQTLAFRSDGTRVLSEDATDDALAWTSGRIIFKQTPLPKALAEVNRYSMRPIRIRAPGLEREVISGIFATGDTEAFASAVAALFGLRIVKSSDGVVLLG